MSEPAAAATGRRLPTVSVIVATRNRARYLERMLDALLGDDYPEMEVIVVDGASSDGTVNLLKSYGNRIARWVSEPDDGEYFAYNKALGIASGEIIKPMSDDDVLRPGAIRRAAEYLAEHPDVDIVFGQAAFWDEREGVAFLYATTEMIEASRITLRGLIRGRSGVCSLAAFVRRRLFDRIGSWSTRYSCGDVEFWARAIANGAKIGLIPDVVVDYHFTGSNGAMRMQPRLRLDLVRLNVLYGTPRDVVGAIAQLFHECLWKFWLRLLNRACQAMGLQPMRMLRRWWRWARPTPHPRTR